MSQYVARAAMNAAKITKTNLAAVADSSLWRANVSRAVSNNKCLLGFPNCVVLRGSDPVILLNALSGVRNESVDQPAFGARREISSHAWSPLALGLALGLLAVMLRSRPALAANLENGEAIFGSHCAACHAGGNNSVVAKKR